jgi:protein-tyrosine-phosphatase
MLADVPGLDRVVERLSEELRGYYSRETVTRYVEESAQDWWRDATVKGYIALFVEKFARERLRALAQAEGLMVRMVPEVLFVCVHNAGRSQMAAGLLDRLAEGRVHVRSAGSTPADEINPAVVEAMSEVGIDISKEFPKPLTDEVVRAADVVVTMGCGDACPIYPGKRYLDWDLPDPSWLGSAGPKGRSAHAAAVRITPTSPLVVCGSVRAARSSFR